MQIADEHGLEFQTEMDKLGVGSSKLKSAATEEKKDEDDLEARLKKLQGI